MLLHIEHALVSWKQINYIEQRDDALSNYTSTMKCTSYERKISKKKSINNMLHNFLISENCIVFLSSKISSKYLIGG